MKTSRISRLLEQGFDKSYNIPFTSSFRVHCSQCQASVINGIACHETRCPNIVRDNDTEDEEY
jgi:hypothetical protein